VPHPEVSERAQRIVAAVEAAPDAFELRTPAPLESGDLEQVHDPRMLAFLAASAELAPERALYPSVFSVGGFGSHAETRAPRIGDFCFDTGTPVDRTTFEAARWSAASAQSAARAVADGERLAYGLCRPPGHHAARDHFGGYCYLNNAAIAATLLRQHGRVAIVDIDYHHGNGTESIFYDDPEVLTISVHADPACAYPHMSGYAVSSGRGAAEGTNLNVPLAPRCGAAAFADALRRTVLPRVASFAPDYWILAVGFDTYGRDPLGHFDLDTPDFDTVGRMLAGAGLPTVVLQEGGYHVADLGANVVAFLRGLRGD
jgi:acetoin utilization deacetylase AcuC-like enzyme